MYFTTQPSSNPGLSIDKSILNSRGWVLQERLLSRRTIHFASDQVYWECREHIVAEDGGLFESSRPSPDNLIGLSQARTTLKPIQYPTDSNGAAGSWEGSDCRRKFVDLWLYIIEFTCNAT